MRKILMLSAAALILAGAPAFAENGGATDRNTKGQSGSYSERHGGSAFEEAIRREIERMIDLDLGGMSGSYNERSGRDRGHLTREVAPGIHETTRIPDRFTSRDEGRQMHDPSARASQERAKGGLDARQ